MPFEVEIVDIDLYRVENQRSVLGRCGKKPSRSAGAASHISVSIVLLPSHDHYDILPILAYISPL